MNLIPLEYRLKMKYERKKKRNIMFSVIILVIMIGFTLYNYKTILSYQDKITGLNNRLDSLRPVMVKDQLLKEEKVAIKSKERLIGQLDRDISYQQILRDLNLLVPDGVVVKELIIDENNQLEFNAEAINHRNVIETINQMDNYSYFKDIILDYTKVNGRKIDFGVRGRLEV